MHLVSQGHRLKPMKVASCFYQDCYSYCSLILLSTFLSIYYLSLTTTIVGYFLILCNYSFSSSSCLETGKPVWDLMQVVYYWQQQFVWRQRLSYYAFISQLTISIELHFAFFGQEYQRFAVIEFMKQWNQQYLQWTVFTLSVESFYSLNSLMASNSLTLTHLQFTMKHHY